MAQILCSHFPKEPTLQPPEYCCRYNGAEGLRVKFFAKIFNFNIPYVEDMAVIAVKTLPKVLWTQAAYFN